MYTCDITDEFTVPVFFARPREGGGEGSEDAGCGGEGVRSEGKEISDSVKNTSSVWDHPNNVGGACDANYIH